MSSASRPCSGGRDPPIRRAPTALRAPAGLRRTLRQLASRLLPRDPLLRPPLQGHVKRLTPTGATTTTERTPLTVTTATTTPSISLTSVAAWTPRQFPLPHLVARRRAVPRGLPPAPARQRGRLQPPHMAPRLPSLSSAPKLPRALGRPPRRNLVARQRGRLQPPRMPTRLPWVLAPQQPRVLVPALPALVQQPLQGRVKRPTTWTWTWTMPPRTRTPS